MTADGPFPLSAAVYLVRPTGRRAQDLGELAAAIAEAAPEVLFHHAQMPRLRDPGDEESPPDDFSQWIRGVLQNAELAERTAYAVQGTQPEAESLRAALLEALRPATSAAGQAQRAPTGGEFVCLTSDAVLLPLEAVESPDGLLNALSSAPPDAWFHHLIEAQWQSGIPGFGPWLRERGAHGLARRFDEEATSGRAVRASRRRLLGHWRRTLIGRRIGEAQDTVTAERREAERDAVAGLVRRLRRPAEEG